jgi:hypothetical protein
VLSPYYLLADAYAKKRAQVAGSGTEGEAWERAAGELVDLLARGENPGVWRFRNPRFRGITAALIDLLLERVAAHRATGDLVWWTRTDLPGRAEEILAGPIFAGAADFVLSLAASPSARAALEGLQAHFGDEASDESSFGNAVTAVADLAQLFLDDPDTVPIARALGRALDPERGIIDAHLMFLRAARHADTTGTLAQLFANLFAEPAPGGTAIAELVLAIGDVTRVTPAPGAAPFQAGDYAAAFGAAADFLADEKRGLQKFVRIVQERHVP